MDEKNIMPNKILFEKKMKAEDILKWILRVMLKEGVTCSISKKDYEAICLNYVNDLRSDFDTSINIIGDTDFLSIVDSVEWKRGNKIEVCRVEGEDDTNSFIEPLYDLVDDNRDAFWREESSRYFTLPFKSIVMLHFQTEFAEQKLDDVIEKYTFFRHLIEEENSKRYQMVKNVAGLIVDDLIHRYVESNIKDRKWPKQCKDIDKYIFTRDIGSAIDEYGIRELFIKLYIHSINVICKLLKESKSQVIELSNNTYFMLAHANYLKILMPQELQFLRKYVRIGNNIYNSYYSREESFVIEINQDNAVLTGNICIDSYKYGYLSYTYKYYKNDNVSDEFSSIMEKRIGEM